MFFKQFIVLAALSVAAFADSSDSSVQAEATVISTLSAPRVVNTVLNVSPFLTVATETVTWVATFTPSAADDAAPSSA